MDQHLVCFSTFCSLFNAECVVNQTAPAYLPCIFHETNIYPHYLSSIQAEVKTLRERATSYEEELIEQKSLLEKTRRDLSATKEEFHGAVQEGQAYKQQAQKLDVELESSREQERMLSDQVEQGWLVHIVSRSKGKGLVFRVISSCYQTKSHCSGYVLWWKTDFLCNWCWVQQSRSSD